MIINQDPRTQTEIDKTLGAEYPNENDSGDSETNRTSPLTNFMPKILLSDKIAEGINSLILK